MDCMTRILQDEIKSAMTLFATTLYVAKNAYEAYWDTDTNTKIAALGAGAQALVNPQVKKEDYGNGTTVCDNLWKFFNNTALTGVDHLAYANAFSKGVYYASPMADEISPATGIVGADINIVSENCLILLEKCKKIKKTYNSNQISTMSAGLDNHRIIFGSEMTKYDMVSAVTLAENFEKFMETVAPTTGDYLTTLSQWELY